MHARSRSRARWEWNGQRGVLSLHDHGLSPAVWCQSSIAVFIVSTDVAHHDHVRVARAGK